MGMRANATLALAVPVKRSTLEEWQESRCLSEEDYPLSEYLEDEFSGISLASFWMEEYPDDDWLYFRSLNADWNEVLEVDQTFLSVTKEDLQKFKDVEQESGIVFEQPRWVLIATFW